MSIAPILPVGPLLSAAPQVAGPITGSSPADFAHMLSNGIAGVQAKLADADHMVKSFVLDDSIPVHQVSYALQQAKLSLELMLQVRTRLVEGYQQLMNMQM